MQVLNRLLHPNLPWEAYQSLPGHSFSSLKAEKMPPIQTTDKMRLGTRVHNYLLDPSKYDWKQPELVKPIAKKLASIPGIMTALKHSNCEVPATATFEYEGFQLLWRGVADIQISNLLIIDFKITEMSLSAAIRFFGYDRQQSGYCAGYGCKSALIISIHPRSHVVDMAYIQPAFAWWEEKCLTHGEPAIVTN